MIVYNIFYLIFYIYLAFCYYKIFKPYVKLKNMKISKVEFIFYFIKSKNRRVSVESLRRNFKDL